MIRIIESNNDEKDSNQLTDEYIIQVFNKMNYVYKNTDDVFNLMFSKTIPNLYNQNIIISFYKDDVDNVYTLTLTANAPIDYIYTSDALTTKFELDEWVENTYNVVLNEVKNRLSSK